MKVREWKGVGVEILKEGENGGIYPRSANVAKHPNKEILTE